jgi:hypothetical protein
VMPYDVDIISVFRSSGRAMGLVPDVKPPRLPRSRTVQLVLEREAQRDPCVKRALQASILEYERWRRVQPQTVRRLLCNGPIEVR